jgi:L-asparaginase II
LAPIVNQTSLFRQTEIMQDHSFPANSLTVTATRFPVSRAFESPLQSALPENDHAGWAIVYDAHASIQNRHPIVWATAGAQACTTFIRSAAKPFQALPLLDFFGDDVPQSFRLSSEDLAIACASHTGSQAHIDRVTVLLSKASLTADSLNCGPDWPGDRAMRQAVQGRGGMKEKLYNNCSGKHAGMLFCCQRNGWPVQDYLDPTHPLQRRIVEGIQQWSGISDIPLAVDGCGAPVFYLPLAAMARLYACLGAESALAPLREAMLAYPVLVGGEGRVDIVIMQASQGRLLAKVGADGVLCVAYPEQGLGLALKIADGSATVRNMTLVHLLKSLDWLDATAWEDHRLAPHRDTNRLNTLRQVIGDYRIQGLKE